MQSLMPVLAVLGGILMVFAATMLLPLGFAKLLYRLKVQGPKTARLVILGIRKKFRFNRKYAPLSVFLFGELHESGKRMRTLGELKTWARAQQPTTAKKGA